MNGKKICCFFVSLFIILGVISEYNTVHAISLSAKSAVLIDAYSGKILYEKNANSKMSMASTTKIMTAVVALEYGNLDLKIEIPKAATNIEGSSIYLCENEILTLRQLIYALLLSSANDAATAIALHISGSLDKFADIMNQKANDLGLLNTHFQNPHGLHSKNHYTTAKDLALLAAYAIKIQEFRDIVSTYKIKIPLCNKEEGRLLVNHNKLLKTYKGAIGIKTGYTRDSGRCLVSAAERNGTTLIAVTLNASDDWNDHRELLDFGFNNYITEKLTLPDADLSIPLISGEMDFVICKQQTALETTLPKNHGAIISKIEMYAFAYAPVEKDEKLGKVTYFCDGKNIGESDIVAQNNMKLKPQKYSITDKIADFFGK